METKPVRAILIAFKRENQIDFDDTLKECEALCKAAEIEIDEIFVQKGIAPLHSSYYRYGKLQELKAAAQRLKADLIVACDELNGTQIKTLQEYAETEVIDRTSLILMIFEKRARSRQARLQVEIAQLNYALPRLSGSYQKLDRQGGGTYSRGLGEKKLALDQRRLRRRLVMLEKELEELKKNHQIQRSSRQNTALKRVALIGYTNAGKSALMNTLLTKENAAAKTVLAKDMLFATLDTSTRYIAINKCPPFLLSDTVGFVSALPKLLIEAFHTTLAEVWEADLLLHVVDGSEPDCLLKKEHTEKTLKMLNAEEIPRILVYNKADLIRDFRSASNTPPKSAQTFFVSAKTGQGIDALLEEIFIQLYGPRVLFSGFFPYPSGGLISLLNRQTEIVSREELDTGIKLKLWLYSKQIEMLQLSALTKSGSFNNID